MYHSFNKTKPSILTDKMRDLYLEVSRILKPVSPDTLRTAHDYLTTYFKPQNGLKREGSKLQNEKTKSRKSGEPSPSLRTPQAGFLKPQACVVKLEPSAISLDLPSTPNKHDSKRNIALSTPRSGLSKPRLVTPAPARKHTSAVPPMYRVTTPYVKREAKPNPIHVPELYSMPPANFEMLPPVKSVDEPVGISELPNNQRSLPAGFLPPIWAKVFRTCPTYLVFLTFVQSRQEVCETLEWWVWRMQYSNPDLTTFPGSKAIREEFTLRTMLPEATC